LSRGKVMPGDAEQQRGFKDETAAHRWNDPDMLEVGNGGMTGDSFTANVPTHGVVLLKVSAGTFRFR
jgi:hypothetical protein